MLSSKLFSSISNIDRLYVDDVFSAYTYTGNGSTQTINNGIDLAGKGGLVWIKRRSSVGVHYLTDSARGVGKVLDTSTVNPQPVPSIGVTSLNANGFSINSDAGHNTTGQTYVGWTFRKAPKFFDVVTYTGNGASNRTLSHQLNADVGMITVKAASTTGDWWVFHRSATGDLVLNTPAAQTASKANIPSATTSTFTVNGSVNTNGVTYVAYLWAHDPSADGIIQCGSFTGNTTVTLGWEPQYILYKNATAAGNNWDIVDSSRGWSVNGFQQLFANDYLAEQTQTRTNGIHPNATGFTVGSWYPSDTFIYIAIRRPNKPPTTGTEVYSASILDTSSSWNPTTGIVGFSPDALLSLTQQNLGSNHSMISRLTGDRYLYTNSTAAEAVLAAHQIPAYTGNSYTIPAVPSDGVPYQTKSSVFNKVHNFFRRAPGFMDVVCYMGTGIATSFSHSLGVVPELMIFKNRSSSSAWYVFSSHLSGGYGLPGTNNRVILNQTNAQSTENLLGSDPNSSWLATSNTPPLSANNNNFVAYLFASMPGISKVGSYTGNGSSQTINCGFSAGARFILIKRTDAAGDWYVWDSARGIVGANDPHLSLNTTAAEVSTDDSVDPNSSGFIVNQVAATNINVTGATYLYLAIS